MTRIARRSLAVGAVLATLLTTGALVAPTGPASAGVAATRGRSDISAFRGLGTWVDAYDFSREFAGSNPHITPAHVDLMWQAGIKTIYLQAAKFGEKSPSGLLSPDLLAGFLGRAHYRGMRVVAWYLPSFGDVKADMDRFIAIRKFRTGGQAFDAIGVDIEWRNDVPDHDLRSRRLVDLTKKLRVALPDIPFSAIVLPPVVTDVINKEYWPRFPWAQIKPHYDVWQPMGYWTNRTQSSGWRDAYRYTVENVRLLRKNLNWANAPVHAAGGIGDTATATDYRRFVEGARASRSLGGSVYDYATTVSSAYPTLRGMPRG